MDKQSKQIISAQYDDLIKKYGLNRHSLFVEGARYNEDHQNLKFQYVLDQLDENDSLLDVGCGLGHLADFSRRGGGKVTTQE